VSNELIRVLSFDPIALQRGCGKVGESEGDDHVGVPFDRSRKNMAVTQIG
jgi:hypothetical protein